MNEWWKIYLKILIAIIIIVGFAIYVAFFSSLLPFCQLQFSKFQSILAVVATVSIIPSLIYATVQFRKVIARPNIKVSFNESGSTEVSAILGGKGGTGFRTQKMCDLFITNAGDAVATIFQIDLEVPLNSGLAVPVLYENRFRTYITTPNRTQNHREILSMCNNGMPFFVNLPIKVAWLEWRTEPAYFSNLPFDLEIKYKVFGNWTSRQEGILKVRVISQSENQ